MKGNLAIARRVGIYSIFSYLGLILINNSEINMPNMWVAYLHKFIGVYLLTQLIDRSFKK
nr:hypothetical protein [Synechococcus sp. UW140]